MQKKSHLYKLQILFSILCCTVAYKHVLAEHVLSMQSQDDYGNTRRRNDGLSTIDLDVNTLAYVILIFVSRA